MGQHLSPRFSQVILVSGYRVQRVTLVRKVKSNWHVFPACKNWLNFSFRGQFEIKILIVRHI